MNALTDNHARDQSPAGADTVRAKETGLAGADWYRTEVPRHARHHIDTIIVGRDPEFACIRPPNLPRLLTACAGLLDMTHGVKMLIRNAGGTLSPAENDDTPQCEWGKVIRAARIHVAIHAATCWLSRRCSPPAMVGTMPFPSC